MKYLILISLLGLVSCSGMSFKPVSNDKAESRQLCIEVFYKLGMKAEEAIKVCAFVEER